MTNDSSAARHNLRRGRDNDAELLACSVDVFIGNGRLFRLAAAR